MSSSLKTIKFILINNLLFCYIYGFNINSLNSRQTLIAWPFSRVPTLQNHAEIMKFNLNFVFIEYCLTSTSIQYVYFLSETYYIFNIKKQCDQIKFNDSVKVESGMCMYMSLVEYIRRGILGQETYTYIL